jgi:TolA-binding protein
MRTQLSLQESLNKEVDWLREVLNAVPDMKHAEEAHFAMGSAFLQQHNYASAVKAFRLVLKHVPLHVGTINNIGLVHALNDKKDLALQRWATCCLQLSVWLP